MSRFLKKEISILMLIAILFAGGLTLAYFLSGQGTEGLLLSLFLFVLVGISLIGGPVIGLFSSLVYIFFIGSFLFYISMPNTLLSVQTITLSMPLLLIYGFSLIIFVVIGGRIHVLIRNEMDEKRMLQEEVKQFVAVDAETGFVNKYRMAIEIEGEMSRVNRYGGMFTLMLFQIDFYDEFRRLYGEKERIHLLKTIAQKVKGSTRTTDLKYRYANERFALLLTNTSAESIEIVYDKLAEKLTTHQLLSGKYVTISYRAGHIAYDGESEISNYEVLFAQVEREMVSREL